MAQSNSSASYTYYKLLIVKKIHLKDLWPFLTPNLKGQPLLFDIARKVLSFQTFSVLQVFRNSWSFLRYFRKKIFRGGPHNSSTGPFREKIKTGFRGEYDSKQLFFNNAFQNVCYFRDIRGLKRTRFDP